MKPLSFLGGLLIFSCLILAVVALNYDTSIHVHGRLWVNNTGLQQNRLIMFIAAGFAGLAGLMMLLFSERKP